MDRFRRWLAISVLLLTSSAGAGATTVTLFDAAPGSLPGSQGELLFCAEVLCLGRPESAWVTSAGAGIGAVFDTTPSNTPRLGYANYIPLLSPLPTLALDRTTGVNLDFELQVNLEEHAGVNRSGFSIIVITDDLLGVELGFWQDAGAGIGEIWAQEAGFTHAEGAAYDTSSALTSYSLQILGSGYSLLADGAPLLSGALRDLSGVASLDVYGIPNYLFIGDNTTSARSQVLLGDITLTTAMVPLPPSIVLMLGACIGLLFQRRRSAS